MRWKVGAADCQPIRVNAQLIDAETGAHLWAESFDENRADLLQTEDAIVARLARTLDLKMNDVEAEKAARSRPEQSRRRGSGVAMRRSHFCQL